MTAMPSEHDGPTAWDTEPGGWANAAGPDDGYVPPDEPMDGDDLATVIPMPSSATSLLLPNLPPSFWDARPLLGHIRDAAWSRNRSADIALHGVLTRLAAVRYHGIGVDTGIGDHRVGLNLFTALVGPSGTGKSSGLAVASRLVTFPFHVDCPDGIGLGSGEGIPESFMGTVEETRETSSGKTRTVKVRQQVRNNVLLACDEGQLLAQLGERKGSTLGPHLRSAWSGSTIGQANASEDRIRHVPAGSYSMALSMCFQPITIQPLLDDAGGGTPQRFLFCTATDPGIPDNPPGWPGELPLLWDRICPARPVVMDLHSEIRAELRGDDLARMRGEVLVPEMDAHRPLLRLKVAGLLALLDGRWDIGLDDWALAETVVSTSDGVRDALIEHAQAQAARDREQREGDVVALEVRKAAAIGQVPASIERVARNIAKRVHLSDTSTCSRGDVRRAQRSGDRHLADAAVDYAESQGWLRAEGSMLAAGSSRPS